METPVNKTDVTEEMSCDIVVVGSGVSGLTAAVQAVNLGKKVIMLEHGRIPGGNWDITYGLMAVDSPLSKKNNIKIDFKSLKNQELKIFRYQVDAIYWQEMITASGENIAWLMEQGVEFEPNLAQYTDGDANAPLFHRWVPRSRPSRKMLAVFETAGGQLLTETAGRLLILESGSVAGIYAEQKGGAIIRINCQAVISAGGGYTNSKEMVSRITGQDNHYTRNITVNDGSTINMCIAAGARSLLGHETMLVDLVPRYMKELRKWFKCVISYPPQSPFYINVNQDATRYTDESATLEIFNLDAVSALSQPQTYRIYDTQMLQTLEDKHQAGWFNVVKEAAESQTDGIYRADTFEELAKRIGLDAGKLTATIHSYNAYCRTGKDRDFDKSADYLIPFDHPPYYIWENGYYVCCTLEGVDYNLKMEVVTPERKAIPGLYVAGTDGAKLYRGFYSLNIPGSCNANNVYSGRIAGQQAAAFVG